MRGKWWKKLTLKPSSPGFSGSKSYNAVQCGFCCGGGGIGVLAGDFIGDGKGDAIQKRRQI